MCLSVGVYIVMVCMERPYLTWTDLDWRLKCIPRIRSQEEAISPMFFTSYFWEWRIATKKFTNKSYRVTPIRPWAWSTIACIKDKFAHRVWAPIELLQHTCENIAHSCLSSWRRAKKIKRTGLLVMTRGSINKTTKRKGLGVLYLAHIQFANPKFKFVRIFQVNLI